MRVQEFWKQTKALADEQDMATQLELIDALERQTIQEMAIFVADMKPNLRRTVIEGLLGLLSIPIANPFSLLIFGRDVMSAAETRKRYSWLYFVQDHIARLDT